MSVEINGKKYFVKMKRGVSYLNLSKKGISNILDIKGLESLIDLKNLDLSGNSITEVKGLEPLAGLDKLNLSSNQIEILKGFDALKNLKFLDLSDNQISDVESLNVNLSATQFFILGNPIVNKIRDIYGLYTIQNLKDYSKRSKEEKIKIREQVNKKKHFIGFQFSIKEPKIIKILDFYKIIFSMKGNIFEINTSKERNYKIIHEIENFLMSYTS